MRKPILLVTRVCLQDAQNRIHDLEEELGRAEDAHQAEIGNLMARSEFDQPASQSLVCFTV